SPIFLTKDCLRTVKGVVVAMDLRHVLAGLDELMAADVSAIVIEEFLEGEEFSLMVLVNGEYTHSFEMSVEDHKRAFDGDTGPNTGGMGAYAPVSHIGKSHRAEAIEQIVKHVARDMVEEELDYLGILY